MPTRMTRPTLDQSRGYDILIWANQGGSIVATSYTILGEAILHGLLPGHTLGNDIEMTEPPSVFFADIPRRTQIGLIHPKKKTVITVALGALHS